MKRFLFILTITILMIFSIESVQAQLNPEDGTLEITYGETRRRLLFDIDGDTFSDNWRLVDTSAGDIPIIRVTRISGQFIPKLRLLNEQGLPLVAETNPIFNDSDEIIYDIGLPSSDAPFVIEVSASNAINSAANPIEYSLSVGYDGQRRSNPDDGLAPLPSVAYEAPPTLATGDPQIVEGLVIPVFGETASLIGNVLTSDVSGRSLTLNQSVGIRNITFLQNGIGLSIGNENLVENPNRRFFSDEDFTVDFTDSGYSFTMASGMQIITNFSQVESLEVREGIAVFRIQQGDNIKQLVFDNDLIQVQVGNNGTTISFDTTTITTDLNVWDTFASYLGQIRLYIGTDSRFISDLPMTSILADLTTGQQTITYTASTFGTERGSDLIFDIDWVGMNDIRVDADNVHTIARNGATDSEPLFDLVHVMVENAAVQFTNQIADSLTFRRFFPDGTVINTLTAPSNNFDILPWETGFRTRNYNNLGADILPSCPCSSDIQAHTPINPANGNFFYSVTDFSTLGQSLALNLTRYYNSHDNRSPQGIAIDSRLSPRYFLTSADHYARFGNGWRHSYQYELDITNAPQGRITFIEVDGTGHYFFPTEDATRWESRTLLSMVIFREGGSLGTWRGETTDGLVYYFDRVGKLTRISQGNQSILITPAPLEYQDETGMVGTFIVGAYGRRFELYVGDESNRIELVRDSSLSQIAYSYDSNFLSNVAYEPRINTLIANYAYDEVGLLAAYDDVRSPYTQVGTIRYDAQKRVSDYLEANPTGEQQRQYIFSYSDDDAEERVTSRSLVISDNVRPVQRWTYNEIWQLVNLDLPEDDWDYQFAYDENTGALQSVRLPTGVSFQLGFDERGNLIRFVEPTVADPVPYTFTYESHGVTQSRSLLTQIRYPNNGLETFTWEDHPETGEALLVAREILISRGNDLVSRLTRYEYDNLGRLVMRVESGNIATIYEYDDVGYLSAAWEGIELEEGEIRETITDRNRASRVTGFAYNLAGQLIRIIDPRGIAYNISWHDNGQVERVRGASDLLLEYSYNDRGQILSITDRGQLTTYDYDGLERVDFIRQADGGTQSFTYDPAGNLLSVISDVDQTTTLTTSYEYDALGNLILQRSPSGLITRYTTSLDTELSAIVRTQTDPTGRILTYRYNFLGQLALFTIGNEEIPVIQGYRFAYRSGNLINVEEITTGRRSLNLNYNLVGDLLSIRINDGENSAETSFGYNERGLLAEVTNPAGLQTQYGYDPLGNIIRVQLPDDTEWTYRYDESSNLIAVIDPQGIQTDYIPDATLNQLESIRNVLGHVTTYSYDVRGNLRTITDPNELTTNYRYDALDRLTSLTNGLGTTGYSYDLLGRLDTIDLPDASNDTRLAYDNDNNIIAISETPGENILYSYDGLGRVTSITDQLGHTTSYEYNTLGVVTSIRDALGNSQTFDWSSGTNFLTEYTSVSGQNYTINTDFLGRVTRILPSFGSPAIPTNVSYSADGYITNMQVGERSFGFEYDANGNPTRYSDALGGEWLLEYDILGQVNQVTNPQGVTTIYAYDLAGRITSVVNYVGTEDEYTENFTYDANGNLRVYQIDDVILNQYNYNAGNLLAEANLAIDENGEHLARYTFDYDGFGRITSINEPGGRNQEFSYPIFDPTNLRVYTVNGANNSDELSIRYDYDAVGNLSNITLPTIEDDNEEDINLTYDALNRRVRYVDGTDNSWAYTYDNAGNIIQISDPLGSAVSYQYDSYDRITQIEFPSNDVVNLNYDSAGNLRSIRLPQTIDNNPSSAQVIEYSLNEIGQVEQFQLATDVVTFVYDPMGNIIRRVTPPNETITNYGYDAAGRLQSISYSNGDPAVSYDYDILGNLLSVNNLTFSYDALGRMTQANGSTTSQINYDYDAATGNLSTRDAGNLGIANYSYDDLYRISQIDFEGQAVTISYDERGRINSISRPNGFTTAIRYDQNDRIDSILQGNADVDDLDRFVYNYDAVGNLTNVERTQNINGQRSTTEVSYSYDIDQRLISERWLDADSETSFVVNYQYDAAGNRIIEERNGRISTFSYDDQNQLIQEQRNVAADGRASFFAPTMMLGILGIAFVRRRRRWWIVLPVFTGLFAGIVFAQSNPQVTVSYEYDDSGNMTLIRYASGENFILDLDYDIENRLISVEGERISFNEDNEPIGVSISTQYTYDEFSRVVGITTLDASYTLYYDGHTLIGMSEDGGATIDRYLNFDGQRILTLTAEGDVLWNLNDRIGSTRRYADSSGNLVDDAAHSFEFGSFGTRIFPYTEDLVAPFGASINEPSQFFAGQLYDPSTRLYLMGVRAYDPITGRFLQPDPIRHDPIGNLYTYARNRPLTFQDPTGMVVEPFTEPLDIAAADTQINPETLIPSPSLPPIPDIAAVHDLQADEFFRIMQLQQATRFGVNENILQVSPFLDDIYLFAINPIPSDIAPLISQPLTQTMSVYESGELWIPDPRPNPAIPNNPFSILDEVTGTIALAYANPFAFDNNSVQDLSILPSVPIPTGLSQRGEIEQLFPDLVQPIQPSIAFESESLQLLGLIPPEIAPNITLPTVNLPNALIEPPVLDNLDALREQTFNFYSRIWTIGTLDCDDCVPPLGFSQ